MKAYILIGMVGSGKSAWARMTAGTDFNVIRIGVDDIRSMIKDRYTFDLQLESLVNAMKMAMIKEVIATGKDVVIDDCHLTKKERVELCKNLIEIARTGIKLVYVWVRCSDETALRRRLTNLRGRSEFEWKYVIGVEHSGLFEIPRVGENENISNVEMIEVNNE